MTQYAELPSHIQKRITEKKQKLASMGHLTPQKIEEISERMQVDFVYNSNKIEGSTLSRGETELVLRGITIGKKNIPDALRGKDLGDILVAQNHSSAIKLIKKIAFDKTYVVTEDDIKKIHGIVMKGVIASAGQYRNYDVEVKGAGFTPPPFYDVSKHMKKLLETLNYNPDELRPIELAAQIHYDFAWIHPFEDGNGRIGRLLLNLILVRNGYPFAVIKSVDKPQYLRTLREMDVSGNFKPFLIYVARCVEQTLDLYLLSKKPKKEDEFLPLAKLAKNTPYSAEYLSLLARKGRIDAIKEGKTWKSTKKIIDAYISEQKGK
ncbi:MAG: Fic family protein [Candidatus Nitrosotenuis sp.]